MYQVHADAEYKATEILEAIDPEKNYFLSASRLCKPAAPEASNGVNSATCTLLLGPGKTRGKNLTNRDPNISSNLSNAKLVEYPDGGQDLEKFRPNVNNLYAYFKGFKTLLEGLVKLHAAGYAHLDIKAANVVAKRGPMSATGNQDIEMRFIDFGFLCNAETFPTTLTPGQRLSAYVLWPHDIYFTLGCPHNDLFVRLRVTYDQFLQKYSTNMRNFMRFTTFSQIPESIINEIQALTFPKVQALYQKYANLSSDETERLKVLLPKIDIFMLGILLSAQYSRLVLQYEDYTGDIDLVQPYPLTPAQRGWFGSLANQISQPLFTLVKKMMDIDFTKRISAADALAEFIPILAKMETKFSEANVLANLSMYRPFGDADPRPTTEVLVLSPNTPPVGNQSTGGGKSRKKKSKTK